MEWREREKSSSAWCVRQSVHLHKNALPNLRVWLSGTTIGDDATREEQKALLGFSEGREMEVNVCYIEFSLVRFSPTLWKVYMLSTTPTRKTMKLLVGLVRKEKLQHMFFVQSSVGSERVYLGLVGSA